MSDLLALDPRYSYYGRTVGLVSPSDGGIDQLAALTRVQGNSNYAAVSLNETTHIKCALETRGLTPLVYRKWEGTSHAVAMARTIVGKTPLPGDLSLLRVDASTPDKTLASLAQMALTCGVLPSCGEALRGMIKQAVCVAAVEESGRVVSCAAASAFAHAKHASLADQAWWGMLATAKSHRGQRLSLILGAHALLDMEARFGFRSFMTGVEPGNLASETVCTRMGLEPGAYNIIGCADPASLSSGRMTK
ncbi:N-acetyltransferase [Primorskyibacter sp. S187A]|uniref:N-acetyltransferase n=1 Tax=Primorskyibacter sp. S187A TaxID=3415130 RepID=UPI003C7CDEC3